MSRQSRIKKERIATLAKEAGLSEEKAYLFQDCMERFKGLGLDYNQSVWATCQVVMLDKINIIVKNYK